MEFDAVEIRRPRSANGGGWFRSTRQRTRSQAQLLIGMTLEEKNRQAARGNSRISQADLGLADRRSQQRIAALTAKQLQVATERIFRTDETAKIKLQTRNIDRVTVASTRSIWKHTYAKLHLARLIVLDLALIDPIGASSSRFRITRSISRWKNEIVLDLKDEKPRQKRRARRCVGRHRGEQNARGDERWSCGAT